MLFRLLEQLPTRHGDLDADQHDRLRRGADAAGRVGALVERFGPIFNQLYGMAEIASIGTMLRKDDHVRGAEGQAATSSPRPGAPSYAIDVRVVDDDGHDVARRRARRGRVRRART